MGIFLADFVLESLGPAPHLADYGKALRHSCAAAPPPYADQWFKGIFHRLSTDPSWFASILVSNVDMEGYSGGQLWAYANRLPDQWFARGLRRHAQDEVRHSRMFANLVFSLFPRLATEEMRAKLRAMSPPLAEPGEAEGPAGGHPFEEILNSAVLINIHETKALVLEHMLVPAVLAYAPDHQRPRLRRLMDRLIADEIEHIRYSAAFIQQAVAHGHGEQAMEAMGDFQAMVNEVTLEELEAQVESFAAVDLEELAASGSGNVPSHA